MGARIAPGPVVPAGSLLPPAEIAKIWKSAQDFEAMALGQMLQPMFATTDASHSLFGGGAGEESWTPMLVSEVGKKIESAGGLGLAQPVFAEMLRTQEARQAPKEPAS